MSGASTAFWRSSEGITSLLGYLFGDWGTSNSIYLPPIARSLTTQLC